MVTCPKCKSTVEVPSDNYDASIRCGICWAMVPITPRERPVTAAMLLDDEPPVLEQGDPFAAVAGRPASGMQPLEDVLRRVCETSPALLFTHAEPVQAPEPPKPQPARTEPVRRSDDEDIRRKRGVPRPSSLRDAPIIENRQHAKSGPLVAAILVLFALAFAVAWAFLG